MVNFNPLKEEEEGKKAKRVIWSTNALDMALTGLSQGRRLVANPFYENDTRLLKSDLTFHRTDPEIEEWKKCANDIHYFVEKYCQLMTPKGRQPVTLRDYQKKYLTHLQQNQLSVYLAVRQCGKTTTTALGLLHYLCFNVDKSAMVCGNKRKTAVEILDKLKQIFYELPYFLKPGIHKWNEGEIALDNGCRVLAEATTTNSGIGFTIHWLILDEFAHVAPNVIDTFYNNIFPVVTAAKAKCTITSTQNGRNLFYRIYQGAVQGLSDYKAFKTDWWEVPEWDADTNQFIPRDEEWYQKQVANFGSVQAFNSQFGCDFDLGSDSLIDPSYIRKIDRIDYTPTELPGLPLSQCWYFKPLEELVIEYLKKHRLIITCDLSEGIGKDYTILSIHQLLGTPEQNNIKMELIGYFRSNDTPRSAVVSSLLYLVSRYCDVNKTLISIEYNTYGELFYMEILKQTSEDKNFEEFDLNSIIKYYNETGTAWRPGIRITAKNKPISCNLFKESFETGKYLVQDSKFLNELSNFGAEKYQANYGNDDMVMTAIQTELVKTTNHFKILSSLPEETSNINLEGSNNIWNF